MAADYEERGTASGRWLGRSIRESCPTAIAGIISPWYYWCPCPPRLWLTNTGPRSDVGQARGLLAQGI